MKLIISLVAILLSGCMYQVTSAGDITDAENKCKDHSGINHITVSAFAIEQVTCQDEYSIGLHENTVK